MWAMEKMEMEKKAGVRDEAVFNRKVYEAARDGIEVTLRNLLNPVPPEVVKQSLETLIEEGDMKCTPLIIASLNGHESIFKFVQKYDPDIEIEGVVLFDGYLIEGTTALWCAAGFGHMNVVKTLVNFGANVNHPTKTNSTPLRAACFDGRLDMVQFLVSHGADINISNKFNNTCLMIAAYKGHLSVVEYLLSLGSDTNSFANCGGSSSHFCCENGHLPILKCLLEHGANLSKNAIGMTPLMSAAERTKAHIVEYLVSTDYVSASEKIEALELLGASYANDKDNYSRERAHHYLAWAMKERFKDPENPLLKDALPPIAAYENRTESRTLEELEAIRGDCNAIHMEGLIVRERILGHKNPEVAHPIIFRGAVYADSARFDRCIDLWLHALKMKTKINITLRKDLLRFAQVFSQMLHVGCEVHFDTLLELLEIAICEMRSNNQSLVNTTEEAMKEGVQEELDDNIHTALYMLVIATKLLKYKKEEEEFRLCRLVYQMNRLQLKTGTGSTLLHLCINADTPVDDFHTKNVCKFPCSATAKLLIQCGADVNAMDGSGDTPLHVIVGYQKPISDFLTLHAIITSLIEAGAHLDFVNLKGKSPFESATTGVAEIILRTETKISLTCLAAKAVRKHGLSYRNVIPTDLVKFVDDHGLRGSINRNE